MQIINNTFTVIPAYILKYPPNDARKTTIGTKNNVLNFNEHNNVIASVTIGTIIFNNISIIRYCPILISLNIEEISVPINLRLTIGASKYLNPYNLIQ